MSGKSRKSSKAIDRPFDAAILRKAAEIAGQYQIILHQEDGDYFGRALEMPHVMDDGKTADACVKAAREVLTTAVAYMLEAGETPPSSASENRRNEQINIRVSAEEKLMLEQMARNQGYRSVSDYVRTASLANAR